jgi:hypothetical protein
MKAFTALMVLALSAVAQVATAETYVEAVNKALHENEGRVVDACIDFDNADLVTLIDPKNLLGQAAEDYAAAIKEREIEPGEDPLEYGIAAGITKVGPHSVQMVINVNDGNGSCDYYTKLGSYVNYVSGTESSEWALRGK